jgi:hypothetical protein
VCQPGSRATPPGRRISLPPGRGSTGTGALAAPRSAAALRRPVGQWLTNQRRPGVLCGHPERRAELAAIDEGRSPPWPLDWQRKWAAARQLVEASVPLEDIASGVVISGDDIGRWLTRQTQPVVWDKLADGQRERLHRVGIITPAAATPPAPAAEGERRARAAAGRLGSFARGLAALKTGPAAGCVRPRRTGGSWAGRARLGLPAGCGGLGGGGPWGGGWSEGFGGRCGAGPRVPGVCVKPLAQWSRVVDH